MARDAKQTLKFIQQSFAAANQFQTNNYAMGSTQSNGALIVATSAGTSGIWYSGQSVALNRSGFRQTNADQSIIVSGETSALVNDPAMTGNSDFDEYYVTCQYAAAGPINTSAVNFQMFLEAASDSGTGSAGSDWTQISSSIPINPIVSYAAKTAASAVASGVVTYSAAHGLVNGQVVYITAGTPSGFSTSQPLFVVNATSLTHGLALVPGTSVTNTALSTSTAPTVHYANVPRRISIPCAPSTKPWIRLNARIIPNSGTAVAQYAGVWVDNVFLSMGRDSAALL